MSCSLEIGKNIIYSLWVDTDHILYEEGDNESDTGNKSWKYFHKNQISKYIASLAAPVSGNIDAIILTGGLAYSKTFTQLIVPCVEFITKNILIYSGEDELQAMAEGVMQGLKGEIEILKY